MRGISDVVNSALKKDDIFTLRGTQSFAVILWSWTYAGSALLSYMIRRAIEERVKKRAERKRWQKEKYSITPEEKKELYDDRVWLEFNELRYAVRRLSTAVKFLKGLEEKEKKLKTIVQEISELEKSVDPKTKKIIQQYSECSTEIEATKNKIKMFEDMIASKSKAEKNVEKLEKQTKFLKRAITHLKERKDQIKNAAREKFNMRIMEVYKILGFRDFQDVEIDEMFHVKVRRVKEERVITQDLNRLSTSERLTIGVIVMLAGKEEYLPDFPFFILDEITTAYDPVKFEKIIKYIKKVVPYVIVTTLAPSGDLRIEHKI